jgi:hypothetical protein
MTVLTAPRHRLVDDALAVARQWCRGRVIDDRPALAHAARVAVTIGNHQPTARPQVIAAALLHDAPEFAPAALDLDDFLITAYGNTVRRLIRAMQIEHEALDAGRPVIPDSSDTELLLLSVADKIVALTSLHLRACRHGDIAGFFAVRGPLLDLLGHFQACSHTARGAVPASMYTAFAAALRRLDDATATARALRAAP